MTTIQPVNFFIPPEIQIGLATGDLVRYGGVVRNGAGQLVKHLREVPLDKNGEAVARRAVASLKNPWVMAGLGLGAVAITGIAALAVRKRKQAEELVGAYNTSFSAYLGAVRDGTLDEEIIAQVITDLDAIKASSDSGKITIGLSTEQSETLVNLVSRYTRELAEANSFELHSLQSGGSDSERDVVVDLRRHLETQREIFSKAA